MPAGLRACAYAGLWVSRILLPLGLLAAIAGAVLYVRLLNGPVSLKFLAEPIARAVAAEMPGVGVEVEDATVAMTDEGGLEFRLLNLRFADAQHQPIAFAPQASIRLSGMGLAAGAIAPSSVVLIEPRLLLVSSPEHGLTLSIPQPPGAGPSAAAAPGPAAKPIEIRSVFSDWSSGSGAAGNYLKTIGVRNAALIVDRGGHQSVLRISDGTIRVDRRVSNLQIDANAVTPAGPFEIKAAMAPAATNSRSAELRITVSHLVPRGIADISPEFGALSAFDVPVSGTINLLLDDRTALAKVDARLGLGSGMIRAGQGSAAAPFAVDRGSVELGYDHEQKRWTVPRLEFASGASQITLKGVAAAVQGGPESALAFAFASTAGRIGAEDLGVAPLPLEALEVDGTVNTSSGNLDVRSIKLRTGGAEILAAARFTPGDRNPWAVVARSGPMSVATFKALWPRAFSPAARRWVGRQVEQGRVTAINYRMDTPASPAEPQSSLLTLEAADVRLVPYPGLSAVEAPKVAVRLENANLEVTMADASFGQNPARRLQIKGGRFVAADAGAPGATGDLTFRLQGPLPGVFDLLEQDAFRMGRPVGFTPEALDGKADAQFKVTIPLAENSSDHDIKVTGSGRITEGRAKNVIATRDIQGATLNFDVTEQALDLRGEMLVGGVPAKLTWQRFFGADDDRQPPLRLQANLDTADRAQLGIDLGGLVQGDVPIDVSVTPLGTGDPLIQVRADLTGAELAIESLAWKKPPGRSALMQFDVGKGGKYKTELQGFRIAGDDFGIDGTIWLDAQGKAREFQFPRFSLATVSRLEMNGTLRNDNVWDVKVTGATFDGRDFFRSLYAVAPQNDKGGRKDQQGIELKAEIDNVIGFNDLAARGVKLQVGRRAGKLSSLSGRASIEGPGAPAHPLEVSLQQNRGDRHMIATSDDAGQVFRLVNFYPNMQGGRLVLDVNLDGRGPAEKVGLLTVQSFSILGDPVVSEVLQSPGDKGPAKKQVVRETLEFDWMRAPFSTGYGQFVLQDAELRGPLLGATLKGKADYTRQTLDLGGTYVPLQGLNGAIGVLPGIGQLLAGPNGEGVLGITFAIQGSMARPQVIVNPLSAVAPGIFREIFQMTNPDPEVTPREPESTKPAAKPAPHAAPTKAGGNATKTDGWSSDTTVQTR